MFGNKAVYKSTGKTSVFEKNLSNKVLKTYTKNHAHCIPLSIPNT